MIYYTLFLIGAILCGATALLSGVASGEGGKGAGILSWVAWLLYIPAFYLLFYAFDGFGVAGAYALWAAGTAILIAIQGARWGDKLTAWQTVSIGLIIIGLLGFGLSGS